MTLQEAIVSLLSDDRYLLYEVRGASEVQNSLGVRPFSDLINEVKNLIDQNIVICTLSPVLGKGQYHTLEPDAAKQMISLDASWEPPDDDFADTPWLA
jgi:hypothetical protein